MWIKHAATALVSVLPTFLIHHVHATNLKGNYTGQLGDSEVKGNLIGITIHLEFGISGEIIENEGTVCGSGMKGKVKLGTMAEETLTWKKKEGKKLKSINKF